jgi:glycosyltransferase involved in cell wall biosynthesis
MNVLVVYPWDSFWSMGEQSGVASFFNAAHTYSDRGHTVDVVLPGRRNDPETERYHDMTLTRVPFDADPLDLGSRGVNGLIRRLWRYAAFRRKMAAAARRVSRERRPDVVVGLGSHAAPVACTVARTCGVPNVTRLFGQALILHMHDDGRIRDPIRFYANFPEVVAFRTPCAAFIIHDDGSRGDLVARRFGVPPDRLHFWRDGVDVPHADFGDAAREFRRKLGLAPEAIIAMSIGRLSPEKNLDRLVEAFAHAAARIPALELVFVGDGPSRAEIEAQVMHSDASPRVRFAGHVTRDDLGPVFAAADFVVSVSERTNMTNSVVEAMAHGVPCVALNSGSTATVVQHERTGLLVEEPSTLSIAQAMCRLAVDDRLRKSLGEKARTFVTDEFERVEARLAREVELVASIVRNAGGGS